MQKAKQILFIKWQLPKKEANETEYWIELLIQSHYIDEEFNNSLITRIKEINKILSSIIITAKSRK
jgi:four helix bundle protein